jgi:peptidyl-prolyl cis-trans isomerase A (cyclophilin A)
MHVAALILAVVLVRIETNAGNILVALDPVHAPVTTANFLRYVDAKKYDGSTFYRTVRPGNQASHRPIQVIQGGLDVEHLGPYGAIPLETTTKTGLRNAAGTIAIARDPDPNTGSSEFFINMVDDAILDADKSPDHYGYAVFGRVVKGMDVARRIEWSKANGQTLAPPIRIVRIMRVQPSK